jgi:TonB-linked SusC/RagA family outer membrane protein
MKKIGLLLALLVFAGINILYAQNMRVTGTVTSAEDGTGIPGATVKVKGGTTGVVSDADGKYSISVAANSTLVFSFVGTKTQEIQVAGQSVINVTLKSDVVGLDEVVVVAYGTATKSTFSGSVAQVDKSKLTSGNTESIDKALNGKIAGVRISSTTGAPGASGEIQVRGVGSISASTTPLYVVDGVAVETGNIGSSEMSANILSTLNPEDIESVSVLKDAAASSLYGSRAANGVVLITTKKGKDGKTNFNFKVNEGWSTLGSDSYKVMNGTQFTDYVKASLEGYYLNQNKAIKPTDVNFGNTTVNTAATQFAEDNYRDFIHGDTTNTDWRKVVYRTSHMREYQFSASGGNEKTTFFTSLGYSKNDGIVLGSEFDRLSGRLNIDHKATKWLSFGVNQMISNTNQKGFADQSDQTQGIATASPLGILLEQDPTAKRYNSDGSVNKYSALNPNSPAPDDILGGNSEINKNKTFRSLTNAYGKINFLPNLSLKSTIGVDWIYNQSFTYWSPSSIDGEALNGYGYRYNSNLYTFTTSTILNYSKSFGDHTISALAGAESNKLTFNDIKAEVKNYSTDKLPELVNGQPSSAASSVSGTTMSSFFGRLDYTYASKYSIGGSMRTDGSSRLGKDNRWGNFYSVSGNWRLDQEAFLKSISFLDELKLRASYGTTGTLPTDYYANQGLYSFSGGYGSQSAIFLSQPENDNLGWEKSRNWNVGVDFGFFKKISLTIEYFQKNTRDLLMQRPVTYLTGFTSSWQNVGKIQNQGLEAEIHTENLNTSWGLKWTSDFNISTLKTEVKNTPNHEDIIAGDGNLYMYREGEAMYSFYLPKAYKVDPTCGLMQFYIDPTKAATSDNLTYYYSQANRGIVGKAIPNVTGGFTNTLSFKGIEFSMLLTYQFGGNLFDYPGYFMHHDGYRITSFNLAEDVAGNYWTQAGDVKDNPRPIYASPYRSDRWSSRYIKSTDNIRIRELSVSYALPKDVVSKLYVEKCNVFFKTTNLAFLYRKTKGLDPDVALNGYRTVDTPPAKTFQIGLSLDF